MATVYLTDLTQAKKLEKIKNDNTDIGNQKKMREIIELEPRKRKSLVIKLKTIEKFLNEEDPNICKKWGKKGIFTGISNNSEAENRYLCAIRDIEALGLIDKYKIFEQKIDPFE